MSLSGWSPWTLWGRLPGICSLLLFSASLKFAPTSWVDCRNYCQLSMTGPRQPCPPPPLNRCPASPQPTGAGILRLRATPCSNCSSLIQPCWIRCAMGLWDRLTFNSPTIWRTECPAMLISGVGLNSAVCKPLPGMLLQLGLSSSGRYTGAEATLGQISDLTGII